MDSKLVTLLGFVDNAALNNLRPGTDCQNPCFNQTGYFISVYHFYNIINQLM